MSGTVKTLKLHIHTDADTEKLFKELTVCYSDACNVISRYVFDNGFILNFMELQKALYYEIKNSCSLKSQMVISALKTVTARYKTVKEQMYREPFRYRNEDGKWQSVTRTLEWLQKPVYFSRPQADLVRNRDYSFVSEKGARKLSVNTLGRRVKVSFDVPECFEEYFDGPWTFGTAKLVSLKGKWYLHIPVTGQISDEFDSAKPSHVVGIDRGVRFLTATYDEQGKCSFADGKAVMRKRDTFSNVRAQLQSKGTKSAKRKLKAISGRENRWMTDVNHQMSKALVRKYGSDTLFVIEDLAGVSFDDRNLSKHSKHQRNRLRSWSFYQFEQMLGYKAAETGSYVLRVSAGYTSQRCPKCGRIHKANRNHDIHEYICDACSYRSNDDRIGAMNLYELGTMYVSGDTNPRFGVRKIN